MPTEVANQISEQQAAQKAAQKKIKRNDALHQLYRQVQDNLVTAEKQHVLLAYDVGSLLQQATDDVERYGHNAIELLAEALGGEYSCQKLYKLRRFTVTYKRAYVEKLLEAKAKRGGSTFMLEHLLYLASDDITPEQRKLLEKRIINEDLTHKELTSTVIDAVGKRSNGGRKLKLPKTPESGAKLLRDKILEIHKRRDIFEASIFNALDETTSDEMDDDVIQMLDELDDDLLQGENDLEALRNRLDATRARIQNIKGSAGLSENPLEEAEVPDEDDALSDAVSLDDLPPDDDEDDDDEDFFDEDDDDDDLDDDEEFKEEDDDDFGEPLTGSDPKAAVNRAKNKGRRRK